MQHEIRCTELRWAKLLESVGIEKAGRLHRKYLQGAPIVIHHLLGVSAAVIEAQDGV